MKAMMVMMILALHLISDFVMSLTEVTGYVGRSAVIRCPYDEGYEGHSKYLCRGSCPVIRGKDIPVRAKAGQTEAINGRFSLHDNITARVFTVTITGLTTMDSGQYWCGVKTGFGKTDIYTELKLNILPATEVTDIPSTTPFLTEGPKVITTTEVTDIPSTTTLVTRSELFGVSPVKASRQPAVPFDVVMWSSAAGIAVLLTLAVVLGCYAAKRRKSQETPDDLRSFSLACENNYTNTGTARETNTYEMESVYEALDFKECQPEEEYERMGAQSCGVWPPGKGAENEYVSMRETLSKAGKSVENGYELSKASTGANNECEATSDTLSRTSMGANNEYEAMRDTLSRTSTGANNEYEAMRDTLNMTTTGANNE